MFPAVSARLWYLIVLEKELVLVLAGGGSVPLSLSRKICPDVEQKAMPAQLPGGILLQGSGSAARGKTGAERKIHSRVGKGYKGG